MEIKHNGRWPTLVLFFLAPAIGELISGSAPPAEFFNPFTLLLLGLLYGGGAILARELRVRWNKGWPTVFALGAAYGILEEGLMVKSFFDPNWMDLGMLGVYGRWAGVNWVWSLGLTIFHTVFSISIPILLVELAFPAQRNQAWLGRRGMLAFSILLAADVIFGFLLLTTYRPPALPYLLALILMVGLYKLAQRLPSSLNTAPAADLPRPRGFGLLGFVATVAFFFCLWGLPNLTSVSISLLGPVLLVCLVAWTVRKMAQAGPLDDERQFALVSGALAPFILLSPLQELDQTRLDNTRGMTLVGLALFLLLFWLWQRVRRLHRSAPPATTQTIVPQEII